jgi:hypothetical protein
MQRSLKFLCGCAVAFLVSACGGGDGPVPVYVAGSDTTLAASPDTTAAVVNVPFTYANGVSDFGTTGTATTVMFTSTDANPAFSISAGGKTATGTTAFGSCIFRITASTFAPPSPLANGNTITVHPCNLNIATKGLPANGVAQSRSVALVLGAAVSSGSPVTLSVNIAGQLTLNGHSVGQITVFPVTGS